MICGRIAIAERRETMEREIFLLLGGNKLNYGIVEKFKKKGFEVFVIDWNEHPQIVGDRHYKIDIKDPEAILDALKKDNVWQRVFFAYSSIDLAVYSVAVLNRAIGLKTISDDGIKYASSKSMMAKRWLERGLLNKWSRGYFEFNNEIVWQNEKMKLIIKPDNSASSRGITVVEQGSTKELLQNAFIKAQEEATDGIVVVEEFVEGTEFTVEMIGDIYGNVCVYGISRKTHTKNTESNRIAVKLHYNSVPEDLQLRIADMGIQCYKALDFAASFGHLEVMLKNDGTFSPIEIGARSSGYIASDLVDAVSGSDYFEELLRAQKGEAVVSGLHSQTDYSTMYFFYDFPEGFEIREKHNLLEFCDVKIGSRYCDRTYLVKGREFKKIDNDNARYGFEILEGPKDILTKEHIEAAEKEMLLHLSGGKEHDI